MSTTKALYDEFIYEPEAEYPNLQAVRDLYDVFEVWHNWWRHEFLSGRFRTSRHLAEVGKVLAERDADKHAVVTALCWFEYELEQRQNGQRDRAEYHLSPVIVEKTCEFVDRWEG